jgi:rhodanese-related sulfurtransferase
MKPPRRIFGLLAASWLALPPATGPASADGQMSLVELEVSVARDYRDVPHLTPEQLEAALHTPENVLLLDARPDDEVGVSRLPGAIPVDPDIDEQAFVARFGELARGRDVVIYCSVGVRSSRLATRVRAPLQKLGAKRVANLRGGIFAWHNTGRELIDRIGGTEWVHPYSSRWVYYLDFKDLAAYEPQSGSNPSPIRRPWSSYLPF